jgi:hypothetical protein
MSNPMHDEPSRLPFDVGWFTEAQYEHMSNVIGQPDGFALVAELYYVVRRRVVLCRELSLTSGQVINQVMAQTRVGHKGIDKADLIPITRGLLTAIFEELDSAGD